MCSSRPADKWKLVISCSVHMDRARQVCARVRTHVFRGLAGMMVNSISKE